MPKSSSQFGEYDTSTHSDRLAQLKAKSKKGYIDEGPVALYHALKTVQSKGYHGS